MRIVNQAGNGSCVPHGIMLTQSGMFTTQLMSGKWAAGAAFLSVVRRQLWAVRVHGASLDIPKPCERKRIREIKR
jgi:hypothetical protein